VKTTKEQKLDIKGCTNFYSGKVRDVYSVDELLIMVASDRISAFDHILPQLIPYKGQVLNQLATHFLLATKDLVPNWLLSNPDPNVAIGIKCEPFKVEMVIRGYLTGHSWRTYSSGLRTLCGVVLPEGMKENQAFLQPIITPTTKASEGHDEDISKEEIINQGIVSKNDYIQLEHYTRLLYNKGCMMANEKGLILVDTKYEFGKKDGKIYLIDEVHTPDSSRYFVAENYYANLNNNVKQKQLSKEFVREWLMENEFQGKDGQEIPAMSPEFVQEISNKYIELYEIMVGKPFEKGNIDNLNNRMERNINAYLHSPIHH
jgi:phosphoribosylaminoimidazole-succinocarboxamide synthase